MALTRRSQARPPLVFPFVCNSVHCRTGSPSGAGHSTTTDHAAAEAAHAAADDEQWVISLGNPDHSAASSAISTSQFSPGSRQPLSLRGDMPERRERSRTTFSPASCLDHPDGRPSQSLDLGSRQQLHLWKDMSTPSGLP